MFYVLTSTPLRTTFANDNNYYISTDSARNANNKQACADLGNEHKLIINNNKWETRENKR
jgi:hypothetical protein